jgi:NAD(P)-dependent dehydrogenase (short-subunit alcohol dehydrogenase family)
VRIEDGGFHKILVETRPSVSQVADIHCYIFARRKQSNLESLDVKELAVTFKEPGPLHRRQLSLELPEKASIDSAVEQLEKSIDAVFSCAGVAEGTPGTERINFVGHRYMIEKLIEKDRLARGSAVCFISSSAGLGWEPNFTQLSELLDITDFDEAAEWLRAHNMATYMGTKQAVCAYVARKALAFLKQGIRINAICPGPTDTPLAQANRQQWLGSGSDFRAEAGVRPSEPIEQAYPMAFLCSDAASAITGITLVSDLGWFNAGFVHTFPAASPIAEFLMGRRLTLPAAK